MSSQPAQATTQFQLAPELTPLMSVLEMIQSLADWRMIPSLVD
jgi:hypothetical protein